MFNKIFNHKKNLLILALLAYFAFSGIFLVAHTISHQIKDNFSAQATSNHNAASSIALSKFGDFQEKLNNKINQQNSANNSKSTPENNSKSAQCNLCFWFNLASHILSFTAIIYALLLVYLAIIFDSRRIKLSHLSQYFPIRAPPYFS
jgi:predicted PurR-regulated permease PerM